VTDWDDLAAAALIGTERRSVDLEALPGTVGAAARRLDRGDDATALLDAAALFVAHRRGGVLPQADAPDAPSPASPEVAPVVSAAAADRLERILHDGDHELAVEWLGAAAAAGQVAAPRTLPDLLTAVAADRGVAAAAAPVLGRRGTWLAAFRPEWRRALDPGSAGAAPADPRVWELGDLPTRRGLLAGLRRVDPAAGRELLAASWARESGPDREALLPLLEIGLSAADEPLLEAALDDRRKDVRATAARLLGRLPSSAYVERMFARIGAAVAVTRHERAGRAGRRTLQVEPPSACDASMVRDGIEARSPGGGERAWWLRQIVAATPLGFWTDLLDADAGGVLDVAVADGWRDVLLEGWAAATVAQRDPAWAAALLRHLPPARHVELFDALSPAVREARVATLLRARRDLAAEAAVNFALAATPRPWGPELTDAFLGWLANPGMEPQSSYARRRIGLGGRRLPPDRAAAVTAAVAAHPEDSAWRAAAAAVVDLLCFRHDMLEELH
jgi:hypothetical protein